MFFILSKIAYFFIHPFTWMLVGLFFLLFSKRNRLKRILRIAVPVWMLFFSNSFVCKEFLRLWEVPPTTFEENENYEVAIVLGGMFEYDATSEGLSVRRGADRIWQALNLYHSGKVGKLLISGDHGYVSDRGLHEAEQVKETLVLWGIPEKDILVENSSKNTYENARESINLLNTSFPHIEEVVLVTSSTHMRRARACFQKQGMKVVDYPTDQYTGGKRHYNWDEFIIPNVDNFTVWFVLIKEWVGYLTYWLMGYL
jgi:uncharacterized SAM-binding protein YcdF (DUF218 family)